MQLPYGPDLDALLWVAALGVATVVVALTLVWLTLLRIAAAQETLALLKQHRRLEETAERLDEENRAPVQDPHAQDVDGPARGDVPTAHSGVPPSLAARLSEAAAASGTGKYAWRLEDDDTLTNEPAPPTQLIRDYTRLHRDPESREGLAQNAGDQTDVAPGFPGPATAVQPQTWTRPPLLAHALGHCTDRCDHLRGKHFPGPEKP